MQWFTPVATVQTLCLCFLMYLSDWRVRPVKAGTACHLSLQPQHRSWHMVGASLEARSPNPWALFWYLHTVWHQANPRSLDFLCPVSPMPRRVQGQHACEGHETFGRGRELIIKQTLRQNTLRQGSPTPRPQTGTDPRPVRNRTAQQAVSGGRASEASSATTHCSPSLALPPEPLPHSVHGKTVFHETGPCCQKGWAPLP